MAEIKKELKTFVYDYKCPKCKTGYLRPFQDGQGQPPMMNGDKPVVLHKCTTNECGHTEAFIGKTYPYSKQEYK